MIGQMRRAAFLVVLALAACGSSAAKVDGGGPDAPADLAPGGSGGSTGAGGGVAGAGGTVGVTGTAGAVGGGGTGGGLAPRDCFPECVAALRRSCQRPPFGTGSCVEQTTATGGSAICYSNGVRELRGPTVDGGVTVQFTETDGQTICYVVVVVAGTNQSWRTPAGQEVAQLTAAGGSVFNVTCAGSTTTVPVDINDPACRTLNSGDCMIGTCP